MNIKKIVFKSVLFATSFILTMRFGKALREELTGSSKKV